MDNHFMVELDYFNPDVFDEGQYKIALDAIIEHISNSDKLVSLSVSQEEAIVWIILRVSSEDELINLLNSIPVDYELSYDYFRLNYHSEVREIGSFSLN